MVACCSLLVIKQFFRGENELTHLSIIYGVIYFSLVFILELSFLHSDLLEFNCFLKSLLFYYIVPMLTA